MIIVSYYFFLSNINIDFYKTEYKDNYIKINLKIAVDKDKNIKNDIYINGIIINYYKINFYKKGNKDSNVKIYIYISILMGDIIKMIF